MNFKITNTIIKIVWRGRKLVNNYKKLICPYCNSNSFYIKREATYVYSYKIKREDLEAFDNDEKLPYLFDNREQTSSNEFIQCENCRKKFPYSSESHRDEIDFTIIQRAIRSDHVDKPEFLG